MTALTLMISYCREVLYTRLGNERGASVIEYAFLVSLIAVFCIGAITMIGGSTASSLSETSDKLP